MLFALLIVIIYNMESAKTLNQVKSAINELNLAIPTELEQHELELELLIYKVFPNGLTNNENLNLAKQLALNWCASMCRKLGLNCKAQI